jgi:competence protein ComEC
LLGPRRCVPLVLVALVLYTALVGADAAVVRAAVMGGLYVVGNYLGRASDAALAVLIAGAAMTAYRPAYLHDLGFQLSFAATLGLILLVDPMDARILALTRRFRLPDACLRLLPLVREAVVVTVAAQVATWPLIACQVGQVSVAGMVANFLIVPVQPAVMGLGALATGAGVVSPALGRIAGALAWLPLAFTIRTVEIAARWPLASLPWSMPTSMAAGYYALLAGVLAWGAVRRHIRRAGDLLQRRDAGRDAGRAAGWAAEVVASERMRSLSLAGLALACALAWLGALSRPDGLLHVVMLDVGQGDSILVLTPNGRRLLVDGGPQASVLLDRLGRRFAPWDRRLDLIVLTHPDADHVGGLPAVIERYRVAAVLDPQLAVDTPDAAAWTAVMSATQIPSVRTMAGQRLVLDAAAGVSAEVLWPPEGGPVTDGEVDPNSWSVVLRLTYGATSALLTGDIDAAGELSMVATGARLRSDVLKVSHHGSSHSSTPEFLAAVQPALALIGVGANNTFGHPAPEVLARLSAVPVRRTDLDGDVEVLSDGQRLWLR